jgi:hypothetical protein
MELRNWLRDAQRFLTHPDRTVEQIVHILANVLGGILLNVPDPPPGRSSVHGAVDRPGSRSARHDRPRHRYVRDAVRPRQRSLRSPPPALLDKRLLGFGRRPLRRASPATRDPCGQIEARRRRTRRRVSRRHTLRALPHGVRTLRYPARTHYEHTTSSPPRVTARRRPSNT